MCLSDACISECYISTDFFTLPFSYFLHHLRHSKRCGGGLAGISASPPPSTSAVDQRRLRAMRWCSGSNISDRKCRRSVRRNWYLRIKKRSNRRFRDVFWWKEWCGESGDPGVCPPPFVSLGTHNKGIKFQLQWEDDDNGDDVNNDDDVCISSDLAETSIKN